MLTKASRRRLNAAAGASDPAIPYRLAESLGPGQLRAAFYQGTRRERLVALDAAAECRNTPFWLASSLVALMGAEDRQVSSLAARAVDAIVRRADGHPEGYREVVPGQALQLISQLMPLAQDRRLDTDIRIIAMAVIRSLSVVAETTEPAWPVPLLSDTEVVVRRQAVGDLTPPFSDEILAKLAGLVVNDMDLVVKGYAAGLLCENALAHGVRDPSADLTEYLKTTLQTPGMPVTAMGGILACLSQFDGKNRTALVEIAIAHPDPAVKRLWSTLSRK